MAEESGLILRISGEDWVTQVFDKLVYYTGLRRKLPHESAILFVHNSGKGDAFVGYGVVDQVRGENDLSAGEKTLLKKGWTHAIDLNYAIRFERPVPVAKTFVRLTKRRGKFLHGLPLEEGQLTSVVAISEGLC